MKLRRIVRCGVFAALISLCAWLSIPTAGPAITMQTFGVVLALTVLGGKYGTVAIATYILLGAVGLPVFSGFRGGIGVLLGVSGGYIWGFLGTAGVYWLTEKHWKKPWLSCTVGLLVCYALGTAWYSWAYASGSTAAVLLQCVVPFLIPDAVKLMLAVSLAQRLKKYI